MVSKRQWRHTWWYLAAGLLAVLCIWASASGGALASRGEPGDSGPQVTTAPILTASPTDTPACGLVWRGVSSPQPTGTSELDGVAMVSASDIWAVGSNDINGLAHTLIMHWDGNAWSIVPSPNVIGTDSRLAAVAGRTAADIWAVGYSGSPDASQTLAEHWDGSQWSIVPSPNVGQADNILQGVTIATDNDAWAVGYSGATPTYRTLTEHWDGTSWNVVPSPNMGTGDNLLHGVSATSATDVWAAGTFYQTNISLFRAMVLHWSGSAWTLTPTPPSYGNNYLLSIFAISQNEVWAGGGESGYVARWNGSTWGGGATASPDDFYGISATSDNDVWAVGSFVEIGDYQTIYHFNGSYWLPVPSLSGAHLRAVVAISPDNAWVVGFDDNNEILIEHYNDPCATPTNTPTPTLTQTGTPPAATRTHSPSVTPTQTSTFTPGSTATATPSALPTFTPTNVPAATATNSPTSLPTGTVVLQTSTPISATHTSVPQPSATSMQATGSPTTTSLPGLTETPTTCAMSFVDVNGSDWYYGYVQYLYCHGVISGYGTNPPCSSGTPCFNPGGNTTRGQVAKIAVLGFGIPINTAGGPHFSDVPPASAFYQYIETAYDNGIITGYNASPPCDAVPGAIPCFKPNNRVTRGQLSKIIVAAAGWQQSNPAGNTFEDVGVGSTFYEYVETAVGNGIIGGYPCGAPPAGPCIAPENRPYFLPANNATRAQISKIEYLAITYAPPPYAEGTSK